jgi:hypothetical protein
MDFGAGFGRKLMEKITTGALRNMEKRFEPQKAQ